MIDEKKLKELRQRAHGEACQCWFCANNQEVYDTIENLEGIP